MTLQGLLLLLVVRQLCTAAVAAVISLAFVVALERQPVFCIFVYPQTSLRRQARWTLITIVVDAFVVALLVQLQALGP